MTNLEFECVMFKLMPEESGGGLEAVGRDGWDGVDVVAPYSGLRFEI